MTADRFLLSAVAWMAALFARRVVQTALPALWPAPADAAADRPGRELLELAGVGAFAALAAGGVAWLLAGGLGAAEVPLAALALPFAIWINLRRPAPGSFRLPADRTGVRLACALLIALFTLSLVCLAGRIDPVLALRLLAPASLAGAILHLLPLTGSLLLAGICLRLESFAGPALASGTAALAMLLAGFAIEPLPIGWARASVFVLAAVYWIAWREVARTRDIIWFLAAQAVIGRLAPFSQGL